MKKKLIIIFAILILTGCKTHNEEYYTNVADTVISFYRNDSYDKDNFFAKDLPAIDKYLSKINHREEVIDIDKYLVEGDFTNLNNSDEVFIQEEKCYIQYDVLKQKFNASAEDEEIEPYFTGICNGNYFNIYESDLYPSYDVTKNDPKYDYVLLGNKKEKESYIFYYRSTYDGSGLKLTLKLKKNNIVEIVEEFVNVDSYVQND